MALGRSKVYSGNNISITGPHGTVQQTGVSLVSYVFIFDSIVRCADDETTRVRLNLACNTCCERREHPQSMIFKSAAGGCHSASSTRNQLLGNRTRLLLLMLAMNRGNGMLTETDGRDDERWQRARRPVTGGQKKSVLCLASKFQAWRYHDQVNSSIVL